MKAGNRGKERPKPFTNAKYVNNIKITAFSNEPFQPKSWPAEADTKTSANTATKKPMVGSKIPYKTTEPVIHSMILKSHLGIFSSAVFLANELNSRSKPMNAIKTPSQNGKYPGPILAAVPIRYWVAIMEKKTPTTINMMPAPKSLWLRIFKTRSFGLLISHCNFFNVVRL